MTMAMFGETHRVLQDQFESRRIADLLASLAAPAIDESAKAFIETRSFFFLSTVSDDGQPTVSHKGGAPGFVKVVDGHTLVFPSYDGNGMFLSMGNIVATGRIGLLFMDFETPHRLRVHAMATASTDDPMMAEFPGADLVVRAEVLASFENCPRYIHKQAAIQPSRYVPDERGAAPAPGWKRLDVIQPFLPERFQGVAEAEGGIITVDEYRNLLAEGNG
jgi:uncharacterized protein